MIFKYDTKRIGERHYIKAIRLVRERGVPDWKLELPFNFDELIVDKNGKLQWVVDKNTNYDPDLPDSKDNWRDLPIRLSSRWSTRSFCRFGLLARRVVWSVLMNR